MHCARLDEAGLKFRRQLGHRGHHHGRPFKFNDLHRRPHGRFHLLAAHLRQPISHSTRLKARNSLKTRALRQPQNHHTARRVRKRAQRLRHTFRKPLSGGFHLYPLGIGTQAPSEPNIALQIEIVHAHSPPPQIVSRSLISMQQLETICNNACICWCAQTQHCARPLLREFKS